LVPCTRCGATGQVTAAEAERVAEGQRRAADRKARGLSLRDEAARLGITPIELADIEHARMPAPEPPRV
jgi:ribosome-binding protein aMBF1 (putative translation factor)